MKVEAVRIYYTSGFFMSDRTLYTSIARPTPKRYYSIEAKNFPGRTRGYLDKGALVTESLGELLDALIERNNDSIEVAKQNFEEQMRRCELVSNRLMEYSDSKVSPMTAFTLKLKKEAEDG